MPKSAKKRKDKTADFSKAKLKLGKGKQVASNAVDTSFKARSIVLPTQKIAAEKDKTAPTTRRGLTLDDLLLHLKHYNAGTRKDAIVGLRELLELSQELLDSSVMVLINGCVRVIDDADAGVRKALLAFFSWFLPRIPTEDLIPHSSLLLLFITSAQTHIYPEIRIDAIRFLGIILEHAPQIVIDGWDGSSNSHGTRILEGYLGILDAGTKFGEADDPPVATSTASVMLTSESKLIVLASLATFLRHSLSSFSSTSTPDSRLTAHTWYFLSSFLNEGAYRSFSELLEPCVGNLQPRDRRYWRPKVEAGELDEDFLRAFPPSCLAFVSPQTLPDFGKQFLMGEFPDKEVLGDTRVAFVMRLARALHPILVAAFLDCAPSVFASNGSPSDTELEMIIAVIQITRCLYNVIMRNSTSICLSSASENLKNILNHISPYFPFRPTGSREMRREQASQDLNLVFCELTSLLILSNGEGLAYVPRKKERRSKRFFSTADMGESTPLIQTLRVSDYVIQLLQGESSAVQLEKPLTITGYLALLPTIWALLNDTKPAHQDMSKSVLKATVEHALKMSSKSALKRVSIEFVARVALLNTEPLYRGNFLLGRDSEEDQKLEDWVTHLPQTMWELGSSNLFTSEIILRFLLRSIHRKSKLIHTKTITSLQSRFIPYFVVTHAVRGQLLGPYSRLPTSSGLRRLVLDLVATLNQGPVYNDVLSAAVGMAVDKTQEQDYWVHIQTLLRDSNSRG